MSVTTRFDPTAVTGKIERGKYTKCMVRTFPTSELVAPVNALPKHPQTTTPISTHTAYISSGFPLNMMNKNQYTNANRAGSMKAQAYPRSAFLYRPRTSLLTRFLTRKRLALSSASK